MILILNHFWNVFSAFNKSALESHFSVYDLKRLESYSNNMLDYHAILDLLPTIAYLYFNRQLGDDVKLSGVQSSILLGIGLQRKSIDDLEVTSFNLFARNWFFLYEWIT